VDVGQAKLAVKTVVIDGLGKEVLPRSSIIPFLQ
jgi:hypothetical protein